MKKHRQPAHRSTRRTFLSQAATAAGTVAAPWLLPASVFGKSGDAAPSERIGVGVIGVGAMGRGHLRHCLNYPEAQVVAVCDVDTWRRESAKRLVERTYAADRPGGTFHGCTAYNDLRDLLARDDVDAVVIATGDNWHGPATVLAARAGKDIYCEKPISKTIVEARAMADAVRRYGRVCQIGLQQRSTPEFVKACRLVHEGRIGTIRAAYVTHPGTNDYVSLPPEPVPEGLDWDLWLGPAPWRPFNRRLHIYGNPPHVTPWAFCRDLGGGNLTNNTVHAFDIVQWGLQMDASGPIEIVPPETGQVPCLTYKYANDVLLQVTGRLDPGRHVVPKGWDPATRIEHFGVLFMGEDGWIHVGRQGYFRCYPDDLARDESDLSDASRIADHHQDWLACIRTRREPVCSIAAGCSSTIVSHLGCIAHWTRQALRWDPDGEQFLENDAANRLRGRAMRAPWEV